MTYVNRDLGSQSSSDLLKELKQVMITSRFKPESCMASWIPNYFTITNAPKLEEEINSAAPFMIGYIAKKIFFWHNDKISPKYRIMYGEQRKFKENTKVSYLRPSRSTKHQKY